MGDMGCQLCFIKYIFTKPPLFCVANVCFANASFIQPLLYAAKRPFVLIECCLVNVFRVPFT